MDAKIFGTFIATLRKENGMTQVELAKKLQVTDKAVSKWERGLGFPDINTIEPLADALGVSVLEIMRSERISETEITQDTAAAVLTDTFELVKFQRKAERKSIIKIAGCIAAVLFLIFLIDGMGWLGFAMVYFPVICLVASVALLIYGVWRKRSVKSAYSSSVMRVLTTRLRWGVLYFFGMVCDLLSVRGVLSLIGEKRGVKRNCF